jgi:hypothetical protein
MLVALMGHCRMENLNRAAQADHRSPEIQKWELVAVWACHENQNLEVTASQQIQMFCGRRHACLKQPRAI